MLSFAGKRLLGITAVPQNFGKFVVEYPVTTEPGKDHRMPHDPIILDGGFSRELERLGRRSGSRNGRRSP